MMDYWWFAVYVASNTLIVTLLAMNVSYHRITLRVANGDGGKVEMKRVIRAHANSVEHVSIFGLIVLALALLNTPPIVQAVSVVTFTVARLLHGLGMLTSMFNVRRVAAGLTYIAEIVGIALLIVYVI